MSRFVALQMSAVVALIILCTSMTLAQTKSDAMQIISMTTTVVDKELKPGSPQVHVTKVSLNDTYALAKWQNGQTSGEKLFQKKFGIGWVLVGGSAGELSASSLAAYDVPSVMATALVAGMKGCLNPQSLPFEGRATSVCFVGPCKAC